MINTKEVGIPSLTGVDLINPLILLTFAAVMSAKQYSTHWNRYGWIYASVDVNASIYLDYDSPSSRNDLESSGTLNGERKPLVK